jgi:hypothetical protein
MADDDDAVRLRLAYLEGRLTEEYGGDPDADALVHDQFALACDRFARARVRRYVPILVERMVRRRLRDSVDHGEASGPQSAVP